MRGIKKLIYATGKCRPEKAEKADLDFGRLINNLYVGLLGREPEAGAVEQWLGQLERGADANQIIEQFLESEEFNRRKSNTNRMFVPPGHFYSPIVNIDEVRPLFERETRPPMQLQGISIDGEAMLALWGQLLPHLRDTRFPEEQTAGSRYFFNNPAFSYGDGSVLSAMLRLFQPERLVEVGSGYSSACAMDTVEYYLDGRVSVTFVEPYPELLTKLLGEETSERVSIQATGVQDTDLVTFTQLKAGDFLFIDSTHVMKTGSDVCHELFTVLPALNSGVFVHFHDIFWPFEYGAEWVLKENRSWNELYGLRAFLMYNEAFEVVFFNDYFVHHFRETIQADYPAMLKNSGGSIWLRKV
jgi:hypothetical protein